MATFQFELSRMLTFQRVSLAVVMALFPPAMIYVLIQTGVKPPAEIVISIFCGMICLLSLLLWATPNVYAELEGRNWTFVVSSPNGRWSIVFGKFLIAFSWSFVVSWIALCLCMLVFDPYDFGLKIEDELFRDDQIIMVPEETVITTPDGERTVITYGNLPEDVDEFLQTENEAVDEEEAPINRDLVPFRVWLVFTLLLFLASMVYAAIFSFVGVLIQRRAMVFSVGYFLLFEVVLAVFPANIGKLTMTYHLFCICNTWLPWSVPDEALEFLGDRFGEFPIWVHFVAIFLATAFSLAAAAFVIQRREYITLEDANV